MSNKVIAAQNAPAALGPYSHAVLAGNTLYISGQLGLDPATGALAASVTEQAEQGLKNLGEILKTAGMDYSDVVKTTVFLADMNDFAAVNEVYAQAFAQPFPARSCVQVAGIPKGAKVEIECIAVRK